MPHLRPVVTRDQHADMAALVTGTAQASLGSPAATALYLDPTFRIRAHLTRVSQELAKVGQEGSRRVLLMLPPQTGKSTLAAVWTPFWWLARNPSANIIIGSYGQSLAMKRGRAIRKLVDRHGWKWGMETEWGARSVTDWGLESGGGIKSVGVGSGVTGSPADLLILDDPHKGRAEADSRRLRDSVWDWWSGDFLTRLSPGGSIIAMLTPWHEDDWAHRVLEQDGEESQGGDWRVLRIPAFADRDDDPLGRRPGDPLPHPLLPEHDIEAATEHWNTRRRQSSVRDWGALYQLNPQPTEGALVERSLLRERRYIPPPSPPTKTVVAIDPSGDGRDTAGIVGGNLAEDGRAYITHDRTLVADAETWARQAALLAAEIDSDFWVIETNGAFGKSAAVMVLRTAWQALREERPDDDRFQRLPPQIKTVTARRGKLLRAEPIAQQILEDRVRLGSLMPELEEEWATWQPTDSDSPGRIDASCYLAYAVLPVPGSDALVSSPAGVPRSRAGSRPGGARIERGRW